MSNGAPVTSLRLVGKSVAGPARARPVDACSGHGSGQPSFSYAAVSRGGPRNASNEDCHLVVQKRATFAVLDGMGGHSSGDLASRTAAQSLRTRLDARALTGDNVLAELLREANHRLYVLGQSDQSLAGMGATVALLHLAPSGRALLGHAGDCRIYRLRDFRLYPLTRDHSKASFDLGKARAKREPERGVTRALGVRPQVRPELGVSDWRPLDRWLLTSDGVTDVLPEYRLTNLLVDGDPAPRATATRIVDAAVSAGSSDDATALVIDIDRADQDGPQPPRLGDWQ